MPKLESFFIAESSANVGVAGGEALTLNDIVQSRGEAIERSEPKFSQVELQRVEGGSSEARYVEVAPPPRRQKLGTVANFQSRAGEGGVYD